MAENARKHSVRIDSTGTVTLTGISSVSGVSDKEAEFETDAGRLTIKGKGLNVAKLDTAEGTLTLETQGIQSLVYSGKASEKFTLKSLFK